MATIGQLRWWNAHGINLPDVTLPRHDLMLDGKLPLEQIFLEAVAVEARQLGISFEELVPRYADDLEKVRELDRQNAPWREQKNRELDFHCRELRENYRKMQERRNR